VRSSKNIKRAERNIKFDKEAKILKERNAFKIHFMRFVTVRQISGHICLQFYWRAYYIPDCSRYSWHAELNGISEFWCKSWLQHCEKN